MSFVGFDYGPLLAFAARSMIDRERETLEKGIGFTGN